MLSHCCLLEYSEDLKEASEHFPLSEVSNVTGLCPILAGAALPQYVPEVIFKFLFPSLLFKDPSTYLKNITKMCRGSAESVIEGIRLC